MTFTIRPATRGKTPLIIGLAGPSKSGKTYSALRVATGMASGGRVVMINTEGERGHMYADKFKYDAIDVESPFSYERYLDALKVAKAANPTVVIIDSVSHAHEGEGGMLDQHEAYLDAKAGNDYQKRERLTWAAWIKPKAQEALFINTLIQTNFSIILCFRAKEKLKIVRGKEPIDLGWQAICSDRIPFETTATLILPPGSKGTPDLSAKASELREPLDTLIHQHQLDEKLGKALAQWASGKNSLPATDSQPASPLSVGGDHGAEGNQTEYITADQALKLEAMFDENNIGRLTFFKKAEIERFSQIKTGDHQRALDYVNAAIAKRKNTEKSQ